MNSGSFGILTVLDGASSTGIFRSTSRLVHRGSICIACTRRRRSQRCSIILTQWHGSPPTPQ